MHDNRKTKAQLITEVQELRRRVARMEEAEKSQRNHAPFRRLAETAASAIFIFQDSLFRYTNPATSKLTGYTAEELLGANIWNLVHPEHRDLIRERVEAWRRGEPVPHRSEFKILTKSGETQWIDADSTFIEFEGNPAALTIAYDSTGHKRAEEALNESKQRYRKIIETAQEAIWVVDAEANSTYVNQHLAEMLGYTSDELLGRSVFDFVDDADRAETRRYLERGRSGIKEQHDFRFRRKDGAQLWTMVSTTPLFDGGGSFVGGLAMLIDITERRRSEEALRKSEERWRTYIEQANDLIFILDKSGRMISVNKAACETTGYAAEEMLGKTPLEFVVPEQRAVATGAMRSRLAGLPFAPIDLDILSKDGRRVSLEIRGRVLYDGDQVSGAFEIARDITDRKRAEEALRETQERLHHFLSFSPAIIYLLKIEDQSITNEWVSESLTRLTGHERREALSVSWWVEHIHPDDRGRVLAEIPRMLTSDRLTLEYRFQHKDGGYLWLHNESRLLRDQSGKPVEVVGSLVDVTERREAEVALRDSEERFRTLVSSMDDMVFTVDLHQRHTGAFGRWIERFGLERKDLIGRTASEIFGVDAALIHEQAYARALAGEQVTYEWSMAADGETRHFQTSLSPIRDQSGKVAGLVGVGRDSTERKRAGEALLASEERYRELVENARDIIYSHDLMGNYTSVNKAVEQITGYSREEALEMNLAQMVAPEYVDRARQMIASKLAGQKKTVYDLEIIAKDGHRVKVEVNTRPVFQDDVPVGIQGIARDVTERKRAEEALRDSQERFRRYFELGLIGMAITSPAKGYLEVNDHLCEMLGYERSELLEMTWAELTHPDELAANVGNFNRVLAGEADGYTLEKRFIRKDGRVIHSTISVKCVRTADGPVDYFVALTQDITKRKQAEQALRESQSRMKAILDNCPSMIFLKDLEGRYLQVNRQLERTFNMAAAEVLGRTDAEIFPRERAEVFRATDRTVLEAGRSLEFEESAVYDDGPHTFIVHKFPLQDTSAVPYAVGGISTDITGRKRAEDDLRKQKEILQKIFDHIPIMIAFFDEDGRFKLVNREWERTLGWSLAEIETQTQDIFAELYPDPQDRKDALNFIAEANAEWADFKTRVKDGRLINTSWANVHLSDGTSIGIGQDITGRKRADDLLWRQTAQLAALQEIGLEISAESELSRVLDVVTRRAAELLNAYHCSVYIRDRERGELNLVASLDSELIGLRLREGEGLAGRVALLGHAQAIADYRNWEGRALMFDPKRFGPALSAPLKWQQTVIGAISLVRKRGEEPFSLEDSHFLEQIAADAAIAIHQATLFEEVQEGQRRLQVLSHRLIDAQEAERKRLARELHDQIGQALTAVQISLQSLQNAPGINAAGGLLEESLAIIDDALQQVHDLSLDLRPSLLDDLGLVATLRWYVGRVASRAGLVHGFKADDLDTRLAPEVETACFRIAQEALTNVLRHASATNVSVEITYANSDLRLLVRDNGVGFDVRAAMGRTGLNASLGLQGMQERAAAVGGSVDIKSKLRRGTKVQATFLMKNGRRLPNHEQVQSP